MNEKKRYEPRGVAETLDVYDRASLGRESAGKSPQARRNPMSNHLYCDEEEQEESEGH